MSGFDPLGLYKDCPLCHSTNYHWKAISLIEGNILLVQCMKCLVSFLTTHKDFLERGKKGGQPTIGQMNDN